MGHGHKCWDCVASISKHFIYSFIFAIKQLFLFLQFKIEQVYLVCLYFCKKKTTMATHHYPFLSACKGFVKISCGNINENREILHVHQIAKESQPYPNLWDMFYWYLQYSTCMHRQVHTCINADITLWKKKTYASHKFI